MGPPQRYWLGVALSYQGLRAIGLPQDSLDSFPDAFRGRHGCPRRADRGCRRRPSSLASPGYVERVHLILALFAQDMSTLESLRERATPACGAAGHLGGLPPADRAAATGRTHFGYTDGISDVTIESSGLPTLPGHGPTIKAGSLSSATKMRRVSCRRRCQRCWAATAPTSPSEAPSAGG